MWKVALVQPSQAVTRSGRTFGTPDASNILPGVLLSKNSGALTYRDSSELRRDGFRDGAPRAQAGDLVAVRTNGVPMKYNVFEG